MPTQTTLYAAEGEHVDDPSAATVRDWDEFLGVDASAGGLDGLVHSLDYGFQDATASPLVHDHHLSSWRAMDQAGLLAHWYAKPGHLLMSNAPFHQSRGGQSPCSVGVGQQQQPQQFQLHRQQQQQREGSLYPPSCNRQQRQQRSHKRRAEFAHANPAQQHFHVFTEAHSNDAVEQAVVYACAPPTKPAAASAATATHVGRWTKKEHELFLEGLKLYGRSWKKISSLVVTRTLVQIRTHAQKYLQKQSRAAQRLAAASASDAAEDSSSPRHSSSSSSSSSSSELESSSRAGTSSICSRVAHSIIDPNEVLSTPTGQASGVAFAGWRLSPLSEQTFLPVAFPASMSPSAPLGAAPAPPPAATPLCSSSPSPSSLAQQSSSSSGTHLVSSFKLDQLLQDESCGTCDDDEYCASPRVAMHSSNLRSDHKRAQRILAPATAVHQEHSRTPSKPSQRRSSEFPSVMTGHELLHTFDHEYAGSLLVSPSLQSPDIADTPRIDEYSSYCDWM